jgi:hypothetical protein
MIATHPTMSGVRIVTFKGIGSMLRVRNKGMLDTSTKHYGSVSFHNGVVNIGPYFAL